MICVGPSSTSAFHLQVYRHTHMLYNLLFNRQSFLLVSFFCFWAQVTFLLVSAAYQYVASPRYSGWGKGNAVYWPDQVAPVSRGSHQTRSMLPWQRLGRTSTIMRWLLRRQVHYSKGGLTWPETALLTLTKAQLFCTWSCDHALV